MILAVLLYLSGEKIFSKLIAITLKTKNIKAKTININQGLINYILSKNSK